MNDWIRRRQESQRPPPRPLQNYDSQVVAFELDGSPLPEVMLDEDEEELVKAIERSARPTLTRTPSGTDEDELQRVLMMSLLEK